MTSGREEEEMTSVSNFNLQENLKLQRDLCHKYGAEHSFCSLENKIGVSLDLREGKFPVNGMRMPNQATGGDWYIYCGNEMSLDDNYFKPLHVSHILAWRPQIVKYLGLPAGWRFLIAPGYEDVWFDANLLST